MLDLSLPARLEGREEEVEDRPDCQPEEGWEVIAGEGARREEREG
jgi:hypothetical protein